MGKLSFRACVFVSRVLHNTLQVPGPRPRSQSHHQSFHVFSCACLDITVTLWALTQPVILYISVIPHLGVVMHVEGGKEIDKIPGILVNSDSLSLAQAV